MGLLEEVGEDSEVHFVAAIRGGSRPRLRPWNEGPGAGVEPRRFPVNQDPAEQLRAHADTQRHASDQLLNRLELGLMLGCAGLQLG